MSYGKRMERLGLSIDRSKYRDKRTLLRAQAHHIAVVEYLESRPTLRQMFLARRTTYRFVLKAAMSEIRRRHDGRWRDLEE